MKILKIAGSAALVLILIGLGVWFLGGSFINRPLAIKDFAACVKAGYPVLESYPRQCKTPDGKYSFTEPINKDLSDMVVVDSPKPNETVKSPLIVTGRARGNWFFEASFPVLLIDEGGNVIAQVPAQAKGEWMTTDFVPFEVELDFQGNFSGQTLTLVLKKDNPSGLPQYDAQIEIPVKGSGQAAVCNPTGCSGQICSDQEAITTCEYLPEYACYKKAACERQLDGQCGWTESPALTRCLEPFRTEVKAFFGNNNLDKEITCNQTFPVNRRVAKTTAVARAALAELLKGPTAAEKAQGYFTSLNSGVEIQKLTIEQGIAKVDFNSQLEFQVGGSCRVSAIRAQITQTLKQFNTVKEVIISVNGRTEDILQP